MIINEKITIKVNHRCVKHYNNKGYSCIGGDTICIDNKDLSPGSNYEVSVLCDFCGCEKKLIFNKYLKNIKNYGLYSCSNKCSVVKYINTCEVKHGVSNMFQLDYIKEKSKETKRIKYNDVNYNNREKSIETSLYRYNVTNFSKSDEFKQSMGYLLDSELDDWSLYKRLSRRSLRKVYNTIIENWKGYDYYDGEYIKDNLSLDYYDGDYPTLDHVISVFEGYKHRIPINEINNVKNLVVTKRRLNSKKGSKLIDYSLLDNYTTGDYINTDVEYVLSDSWELHNVNGEVLIIDNLCKFCRENNLLYDSMKSIHSGRVKKHKSWVHVEKLTNNIVGNKKS